MNLSASRTCIAFHGHHRIASGKLSFVARQVKEKLGDDADRALILDNQSSQVIEVDFRGTADDVVRQFTSAELVTAEPESSDTEPAPKKRGRPKLGVKAREITLLPRHWDWLGTQPGGASVALRKLVEQARRDNEAKDRARLAQDSVYRFMTTVTSRLPEYEEALRALYADDPDRFQHYINGWPDDLVIHIKKLALPAFSSIA